MFSLPEVFCGPQYAKNALAAEAPPRPRWGAHDAPPDLIVGWGPPPHSPPHSAPLAPRLSRFQRSKLGAFDASVGALNVKS